MRAKNLIAMGILIALIAFMNACKNPSTQVNDKFEGKWYEKPGTGYGDTVIFYPNGNISSKFNSTYLSYSVTSMDTIEFKGSIYYGNHRSKYLFYSNTELHILSFGLNLIGTSYDSIILLKN